jgi:hypothetical protein
MHEAVSLTLRLTLTTGPAAANERPGWLIACAEWQGTSPLVGSGP